MPEKPQDQHDQLPKKSTALALPKKSQLTRAVITGAEIGAYSLGIIRSTCQSIISYIRDRTEAIIREGEKADQNPKKIKPARNPIKYFRNAIRRTVYHTVKFGRKTGRSLRWVNKVNVHAAPNLLDEHNADILLKNDIVDDLESRIGLASPFIEEIERIGRACFDRGIPAERLIAFLESKDVLTLLVDEVLKESHYRGSNIKARIGSVIDALIYRLKNFANKKSRKKVDKETDLDLRKKLEYFKTHYNPHDKKHTISKFIKELEIHHNQYDISTWIKSNKDLFIEIIRGRAKAEYDEDNFPSTKTRHVANIVHEVYEARGQIEPEKFIELNLNQFFFAFSSLDISEPASIIKMGTTKDNSDHTTCFIDMHLLEWFFNEKLQKFQSPSLNLRQLREKLANVCNKKINDINTPSATLIFKNSDGTREIYSSHEKSILTEEMTRKITETCQFVSSHVDVRNLLFDPLGIPQEMRKNYEDWFDKDGELDKTAYRRYLRGIFGHTTVTKAGETKDEQFNRLKVRSTAIFENVNKYLASVSTDLDIPEITIPSVEDVNDYAELIKIVCSSENPRERFAARRKIELAALMYTCMITPRYVYQDYDAKAVKATLEHSDRGITYQKSTHDTVYFFHDNDSQPTEVRSYEVGKRSWTTKPEEINLIPITFGGEIDCHIVPTSADDGFEYMSQKSLFSMLTNLLNEDNKRAKDMTDLLRMTFVAGRVKDLIALQKNLETNYISFGRSLKRENRYGELIDVGSNVALSENGSKSDEYHTLRYVVDIPVPDKDDITKVYAVPVEIRILLTEDLIKEKSAHHPASHQKYEERRLQQVLRKKIAPQEIFPEIYKQVGPDPDDIFQTRSSVVKDRSDYTKIYKEISPSP